MEKLNIGVDADGVMVDMSAFNLRDGAKFFKKTAVKPEAYSPAEMFDVSKDDEFKFGLKYFLKYIKKEPAREHCSYVLNKLCEEGNQIHSITARKFTTMENLFGKYNRYVFEQWLLKNNIFFSSIQYCSEENTPIEKLMACSKLGIDVMVEDKPDVASLLAEYGVTVLLFDCPYNRDLSHENIIRVHSWDEVYERVNEVRILKSSKPISQFEKKSTDEIQNLSLEEKRNYFLSYREHLRNLTVNEELFKKGNRRYKLLYSMGVLPAKLMFKTKIINPENIPYQGGFIVASNHENSNDQYLIDLALKGRAYTGFAAHTIKNTFRGKLFDYINGAVFIDRNDPVSKANGSEELATRIAHDQVALIFPEGTRKNKDEEGRKKFLLPFKLGTVAIAQKTGAAILPISISYSKKYSLVRVGTPMIIKPDDDLIEKNQQLFDTISELKKENISYIESETKVKSLK